jgi:MFS family permease
MLGLFYREFDSPLRIGWVVTGYWLVASISAAICGRLGDVVGRRRMSLAILGIAGGVLLLHGFPDPDVRATVRVAAIERRIPAVCSPMTRLSNSSLPASMTSQFNRLSAVRRMI